MKKYLLISVFMISNLCNAMYQEQFNELMRMLKFAIERNDMSLALDSLNRGAEADATDPSGTPVIVMAAQTTQNTNLLNVLLQHGADINQEDLEGETALTSAIRSNPSVVSFLLQRGADANAMTYIGETPLTLAVIYRDLEMVRRLLDAHADPNQGLVKPLGLALERGKHDIAVELLNRGADHQPFLYHPLVQRWVALEYSEE